MKQLVSEFYYSSPYCNKIYVKKLNKCRIRKVSPDISVHETLVLWPILFGLINKTRWIQTFYLIEECKFEEEFEEVDC